MPLSRGIRISGVARVICMLAITSGMAFGQDPETDAPLSVIDWLDQQSSAPAAHLEPPVTESGASPEITVVPLDASQSQRLGLVPSDVTGIPDTLWSGSDGADLARALDALDVPDLPAAQALLYSLVLTEALPPARGGEALTLGRIDTLRRMGALDPALALSLGAGPDASAAVFERYARLSLIAGTPEDACKRLLARPALNKGQDLLVFCTARSGDWDTAVLIFGTSDALGLFDPIKAEALFRYLDPESAEGLPPMAPTQDQDPLTFTLYDALGERLPTRGWPRIFAHADLDERAGWKSQIEAAERLAETGAVPENRLLGFYTAQRPAASGGVWDRVAAIQRLDTALKTGSVAAVEKTLATAWAAAEDAKIERQIAALFAERLAELPLSGTTADQGFRMLLLSPAYERAAEEYPLRAQEALLAIGLAQGEVQDIRPGSRMERALIDGFRSTPADATILGQARDGRLGEALLGTLELMEDAAAGDVTRIPVALATLRALGLEDTARQAALQLLYLKGRGT